MWKRMSKKKQATEEPYEVDEPFPRLVESIIMKPIPEQEQGMSPVFMCGISRQC